MAIANGLALPDIVIAGAQKAGTSTVATWLGAQPGVHMSNPKEPFFFDRDDPLLHPHFFNECREDWLRFDWNGRRDELLRQYSRVFDGATDGQLLAEASTSYLCSERALLRIREVAPDARIIVVLRHPVDRLYSAYWHELKMRRAIYTFEKYLQFEPHRVLVNSLYEQHIRRLLDVFERSQVHFVVTEELRESRDTVLDRLTQFLGLATPWHEPERASVNEAAVPRAASVQRLLNRALHYTQRKYTPWEMRSDATSRDPVSARVIHRLGGLNLGARSYEPMNSETRAYLDAVLKRENAGLAELIDADLDRWWWSHSG